MVFDGLFLQLPVSSVFSLRCAYAAALIGAQHYSQADELLSAARVSADPFEAGTQGPDDPEGLILLPGGAGGGARRWDGKFWAHPLPPVGPVKFIFGKIDIADVVL